MLEGLAPFFRERRYPDGGVIFRKGVLAHSIYFITAGEVTLWAPRLDPDEGGAASGGFRARTDLEHAFHRRILSGVIGGSGATLVASTIIGAVV